jgi:hypothetical protein
MIQSLVSFFDPKKGDDMFLRNVGLSSRTTRRYKPEDRNFHIHRCETLKPNIDTILFIYIFSLETFVPLSLSPPSKKLKITARRAYSVFLW